MTAAIIARRTAILVTVANALKAQGRQSLAEDNVTCKYLGAGGAKCAVGHLLNPARLVPEMEGVGIVYLMDHRPASTMGRREAVHLLKEALDEANIAPEDYGFLKALQWAHDGEVLNDIPAPLFWGKMRERLAKAAREYDLDPDVIPV